MKKWILLFFIELKISKYFEIKKFKSSINTHKCENLIIFELPKSIPFYHKVGWLKDILLFERKNLIENAYQNL
jgi:hypothetical protein